MFHYVEENLTPEELAHERDLYTPLTDSVRQLVDATIRTEVDDAEIHAVRREVDALVARLRAKQIPSSFGARIADDGTVRTHGNAVIGMRNPIAIPLDLQTDEDSRVWADFHAGAAYEGPPGLVHGGVSALLLDQVLGTAAAAAGSPGMTGTLSMRYRRGTPLGDLHIEAKLDRTEGIKSYVKGHIADADGVTVEAEGVFILPRWARELIAAEKAHAPKQFE